jgi:Zn-dependent peptidase ImmA (M78 family)
MPSAEIGAFLRGVSVERLASLKAHWRVSMQSILMRAGHLGAISDSQQRRLWATMNALGFSRAEPVEIPPEVPTLMKELVEYHVNDLKYSLQDVAGAVRAEFDEFSRTYLSDGKPEKLRRVK